jgi:organic radical activating enzyme
LEEGYISSKITKYNFALAQIELIPNENFDGNFETIGDLLNKFDYMFHKEVLYEIENKNNNTTIMEKMRNKVFWPLVKKLAIKDKLIETFDESNLEDDSINQIMQWKMKERKKND